MLGLGATFIYEYAITKKLSLIQCFADSAGARLLKNDDVTFHYIFLLGINGIFSNGFST